jgi:PTS system N-acetylglucosamine-specific IIC component
MQRFIKGDPSAGAFMSGFFPVMMFGLPAACLAMYHTALPGRRRAVGGLLGSIALTSLLTGVTEPIEFTFIFLAPALYAVHALLTGAAFIVMNALGVHLGFGFSAGLIDYVLNYSRATRPLWLLPVGLMYFALYYGLFRLVIVRLDLKTPGRDATEGAAALPPAAPAAPQERAREWITALGGAANLLSVDACTTRLRLAVASQRAVDAEALTRLGARGLVRASDNALQVVVGTMADQIAGEIRSALPAAASAAAASAGPAASTAVPLAEAPVAEAPAARPASDAGGMTDAASLLAALGGRDNVRAVETAASRLRLSVVDAALVDRGAIRGLGLRGMAVPEPRCVHIIVGPGAAEVANALRRLLNQAGEAQ